jgi:hypothetical protein
MTRICSRLLALGAVTLLLILLAPFAGMARVHAQSTTFSSATVSVFAAGLNSPRGLTFGPDGNLYVAEAGLGGTHSTVGQCPQVPAPVGPYTGGKTARISKISPAGVRSTVIDHLPSGQTTPASGGNKEGVEDVAFIGNTLYALLAGGGCSHGNPDVPNGILRVNRTKGTWTLVADLSHFIQTHPVKHPDADDFEPDGTWYSMVAVHGTLYATEPNHQEVDRITPSGQISRVIDLSTLFVPPPNWQGPTSITFHHGTFYFGTLGTFPVRPGAQNIYQLTPDGFIKVAATDLTTVLGVAFDSRGHLFALEADTVAGFPGPQAVGTGKVVCVNSNGTLTTVASGLTFPTAMTFGPGGALYVSNIGFGIPTPGAGQILRINVGAANCH